jgi:ATP-binding cassette subfamily B multidrug efflux pump
MKRNLQRIWPYLWKYKRGWAVGFSSLILKDITGALLPLVIRSAIDALTSGKPLQTIAGFALLLIAVSLLKGFFMYWMRLILVGISRDVEYDIRNDLFQRLVTLSPGFFARRQTGDLMARSTNDLNAVRMMLGPGIMYWTETSLTFLLAIGIMVWIDWRLAILALLPAPLVSFNVIFFGSRIHSRFQKIQEMFSDISSRVQENLSGVRMVRAFAQEDAEIRRFEKLNQSYITQNLRLARLQGTFEPLLEGLIGLTFIAVLWAGGTQVLQHRISLGSFVMFNTYMSILVWPMIALGWVVNLMQRGTASLSRVLEIMDQVPAIAAPVAPVSLGEVRGDIAFENVTVEYPAGRALGPLDLTIRAGTTVAIVGRTGSGKSTLVNLIPRLLDPATGVVRLDGIDVRDVTPHELRAQIGMVPQETFLFSATIEQNIAFGVENVSREEVERAAELAGLSSDIAGFPNGFETMVGERGLTLSGGQKQRTAIARALVLGPRILILDDALSSVDTLTEDRILSGLAHVAAGRTVILISHRVSTVRSADEIIVLDKGRIVERGNHDALLAQAGYYADLARKQTLEEELEAI